MKGYIYKISSPDEKINYYGLSTTNIYFRLYHHIKGYIKYTINKDSNYCSSYKIFEEYGIDYINIKLIEKHDNITMEDLQNRETYYIQNNDCCNINKINKKKYESIHNKKEFSRLSKLSEEQINNNIELLKNKTFSNNEILHIHDLLNIFGFEINNNLIKLNNRTSFYNIKDELKKFINTYYKLFNLEIYVNNNNILTYIDKILINYGLLLNRKPCKTKSIEGNFKNDYKFEIVFI
jgi:hypothetical protein